ncbi:MAG: hypothetical protein O7G30_11190, partial [Proteobacteria bacterium]|nr:hypothetical protein [Pseudomonadota bacterium]
LENEAKAIEYFLKCLALDALPAAAQLNLRFNLSQLYMAEGRFAEATRELEAWFESAESPSGLAYYLLAIAYHQQDRADDALVPARKAVEMTELPRESWLSLLLALYVERDDLRRALPLAKQLVARFPKKSYWLQLVGIYGGLEQDENALAAMQLAYNQGHLSTDSELRRLARMYLFHAIPYRAARVLEKGLEEERIESDAEAWQLLADSWLGASEYERALGPLRRAAGLSEDGLLYVRLGQVYIEREDWEKASSALQNALEKAGLDDPGRVNLLLGVASYNREQLQRASRYFGKAQKSEKSREAATRWLHHLELERQRADRASAS